MRFAAIDRREPEARTGFGSLGHVLVHQEGDVAAIWRDLRVQRRAQAEHGSRLKWVRCDAGSGFAAFCSFFCSLRAGRVAVLFGTMQAPDARENVATGMSGGAYSVVGDA